MTMSIPGRAVTVAQPNEVQRFLDSVDGAHAHADRGYELVEPWTDSQIQTPGDTLFKEPFYAEQILGRACPPNSPAAYEKSRLVRSVYMDKASEAVRVTFQDFRSVGTISQLRAAVKLLYAGGVFDGTEVVGALDAPSGNFIAHPVAGMSMLGYWISWGVQLANYTPFTATVSTTQVASPFGGALNNLVRSFRCRFQGTNSGTMFVLNGQRVVPGMEMAQAGVGITGAAPTVTIGPIPAALQTVFVMTVRALTAFDDLTADVVRGIAYRCGA